MAWTVDWRLWTQDKTGMNFASAYILWLLLVIPPALTDVFLVGRTQRGNGC